MLQRNSSSGGGDSSLPEEIAEEPALGGLAGLEKNATGYVDRFRNMLDGKPSWFGNASKEDFGKIKQKDAVDQEVVKMVKAPNTGSEENKNKPLGQDTEQELSVVDTQENARVDAYERIGTDAGDPEGLLKSLFGRSYKPMDDGALALINLGAGIAKGDVAGGMLGAVKSIGESRDRDRKDMLAKAQAEFYASGGRGAKDTLADLTKQAQLRFDKLGPNKYSLYKELTGKTDLTNDDLSDINRYLMNHFINLIANEERIPASSVGIGGVEDKREIQRRLSNMSQDMRLAQ